MLTTTLKEIHSHQPCADGWKKLRKHLGLTPAEAKTSIDPLPILTVLESNGVDDAIWVIEHCTDLYICRLFAADCAESVLHLFEAEYPDDDRPRRAIAVARDASATDEQMSAARDDAWAAVFDAWTDADAAVEDARTAEAAARAAEAAAWAADAAAWAAEVAAVSTAVSTARFAARVVAEAAAVSTAVSTERAFQEARLRQYLEHGEAAKDMPWPEAEDARRGQAPPQLPRALQKDEQAVEGTSKRDRRTGGK